MTILTHNSELPYLNELQSNFLDHVSLIMKPHNQTFDIQNYSMTIEKLASYFQEFCRCALVSWFSTIDQAYKDSELLKRDYYVHNKRERTIITVFGVIRFERTIYKNKSTGKTFTYLDRKLGLPKWTKYDPCIKAMIYELYADQNSMIKVRSIIGDRIYSPFSVSKERHQFNISRQTVYNVVKDSLLTHQAITQAQNTPNRLYIMADEKYVHTQGNDKDAMIKAAVVFEDNVNLQGRNTLINKTIYASLKPFFWEDVYDVVSIKYDLNSIEEVIVLGDGASWIKSGAKIFSNGMFVLDKFHYKQTLNRISKDKDIKQIIHSNIINQNKPTFIDIINAMIKEEPKENRKTILSNNKKYILNNWQEIQRAYEPKQMGCSMESAISHMFASIFTSRPKGYKKENLERYLNNRIQFLNNVDLRLHYLNTLTEP
ncbi:UPF0236 family transposase-like protein [Erysipelothrix urinaevulpis]|uniref:UPF0236 family transposase-like protein n=1 Tax=Erysipelothrix urinaevulpis TaxID=2683717 RepID=UPI00135833CA|nr:UPF0236 family protein [Erysipelothrix urinaevulpis]